VVASRPRRRWPWIVLAVTLLVLGAATAAGVLLAPTLAGRMVRTKVIPTLEQRFNRRITVGRIESSLRRVVLEDVRISGPIDCEGAPLLHVQRVVVDLAFRPLLSGELRITGLTVEQPRSCVRRLADGRDNLSDILENLARRRAPRRLALAMPEVPVTGGSLEVRDEGRQIAILAPALAARLRPGGQSDVTLGRVKVAWPTLPPVEAQTVTVGFRTRLGKLVGLPRIGVSGGRVQLHEHLVLTDVTGDVLPASDGSISLDLRGGYGGVEETLWLARGKVQRAHLLDPRRAEAELRIRADRFSLDKLAPILRRQLFPSPEQAVLGVDVDLTLKQGKFTFSGQASLSGLAVTHPYLSSQPLTGIGGAAQLRGVYDVDADRLSIADARLTVRSLVLTLVAEVERLRGHPRLKVSVAVPRTRCSHVLAAIPAGLAPKLRGVQVRGDFAMKLSAQADFAHLSDKTVALTGSVDAKGCKVGAVPFEISADRLKAPFAHEVTDLGQQFRFDVGPESPWFVPLDQISPHVIKAILTTEDSRFYFHKGFIAAEFQQALVRNLKARRFVFGASSITMQMVKNVLLNREKTLSRKFQELILTWYLEQKVRKDRILEIYLNVIEFGPGIFGIGRAAKHLFGKTAQELEPQEAAYLATILPSPKRYYKMFCHQAVTAKWRRYVNRILAIMQKRGRLTPAELALAETSELRFSEAERGTVSECLARIDRLSAAPGEDP
jgi:hypothetical protein